MLIKTIIAIWTAQFHVRWPLGADSHSAICSFHVLCWLQHWETIPVLWPTWVSAVHCWKAEEEVFLKNSFITGRQVPSVLPSKTAPSESCSPSVPALRQSLLLALVPAVLFHSRSCTQQTPSLPPACSRPLPPSGLPTPELQVESANKII